MEIPVHLVPAGPAVAIGQTHVLASRLRLDDAVLFELQQAELRVPGPGAATETPGSWILAAVTLRKRQLLTQCACRSTQR